MPYNIASLTTVLWNFPSYLTNNLLFHKTPAAFLHLSHAAWILLLYFFTHVLFFIHNCPKIFEFYLLSRFYFHCFVLFFIPSTLLHMLIYYLFFIFLFFHLIFILLPSCTTLQSSYSLLNSSLVSTNSMICLAYSVHQVVPLLPDVSTYPWSRGITDSLTLTLGATQLQPQTCMLSSGYLLLRLSHFYTFLLSVLCTFMAPSFSLDFFTLPVWTLCHMSFQIYDDNEFLFTFLSVDANRILVFQFLFISL